MGLLCQVSRPYRPRGWKARKINWQKLIFYCINNQISLFSEVSMLTHLSIHNFTLVDHLDLDLKPGMTVITGETGAGKSIVLDALGQTLGDRADATRVRHGAERADITANFDISALGEAQQWLAEQELTQSEAPNECLLRRMITA